MPTGSPRERCGAPTDEVIAAFAVLSMISEPDSFPMRAERWRPSRPDAVRCAQVRSQRASKRLCGNDDAAFAHDLLKVTVTDAVFAVPAHARRISSSAKCRHVNAPPIVSLVDLKLGAEDPQHRDFATKRKQYPGRSLTFSGPNV